MRPKDLPSAEKLAKRCGTRIKYMAGCRCEACTAANTSYESKRKWDRIKGNWNGLVPAEKARKKLLELSSKGVGRRAVARIANVGETTLQEVVSGKKRQVRAMTERAILSVDPQDARLPGSLVCAARYRRMVDELVQEGFSRKDLGRCLGLSTSLYIYRSEITWRTARRIEEIHREIIFGNGQIAMRRFLSEQRRNDAS